MYGLFIDRTKRVVEAQIEQIGKKMYSGWNRSWVRGLKRAKNNGVKILLGTDTWADSVTPYGKFNVGEIKLLVDVLEMTPLEAITTATKYGAEACGIGDQVGTVEKGKLADLLVVKRDPASNIDVLLEKKNIKYVIKEGVFVVGA